ncbi:MAG TPA: methyltransferase domain-containing protein [Candidatus Binataceae bacterium]|nr:methyltransferase domain-containing protein [Candidatus Binataceae bacterium]
MAKREWATLADWFDENQGDAGDLWHRTLIFPGILKVIGSVKGRDILDVGCGNGSLARILARIGNRVTGTDGSSGIIEHAKRREAAGPLGVKYFATDAADLSMFEGNSFDLVTSCMALMDMPDAAGAIREMGRVVRRSGRCVMLFSHPCFDIPDATTFLSEWGFGHEPTISIRLERYREVFSAWLKWSHEVDHEMLAYHRPLSWYFRAIRDAGLAVTMLDEPEPTPEFLEQSGSGAAVAKFPLHCVIEARPFAALR